MENNDYYESAIKTVRKPFIHDETGVKIGEEIKTTYKICTTDCISKQQLVSFVKEKIKFYEEDIENSKKYLEHKEIFQQVQNNIHKNKCIIRNLQDILDFVNKGGKDE